MKSKKENPRPLILMVALTLMMFTLNVFSPTAALAQSASAIDRNAKAALASLYQNTPGAKALADKAVAVLISRPS